MNNNEIKVWANEILAKAGISTKNEKARVEKVSAALDVIATMPNSIGNLFRETIVRAVNHLIDTDKRIREIWAIDRAESEAITKESDELCEKCDNDGARAKWKFVREMSHAAYIASNGWNDYRNNKSAQELRAEAVEKFGEERVARWEELGNLFKITGNSSGCAGSEGYAKKLAKVAVSMRGFCEDITTKLEGVPEGCETDARWGVGGYFNAIVFRGEKRVSFKSFLAGGWNIQCLHIRVRTTLLK